jgi:hypothetical protein
MSYQTAWALVVLVSFVAVGAVALSEHSTNKAYRRYNSKVLIALLREVTQIQHNKGDK